MNHSSFRPIAIGILLLAFAAVAIWFAVPEAANQPHSITPRTSTEDEATPEARATSMVIQDEAAEEARKSVGLDSTQPGRKPTPEVSAPLDVLARGRLLIEELDGSQTWDATGTLTLTLWHENTGSYFDVEVTDGNWVVLGDARYQKSLERAQQTPEQGLATRQLRPDHFESGTSGSTATTKGKAPRIPLATEDAILTLYRTRSVQLYVTDAQTGAAIDLVEVRDVSTQGGNSNSHPGDAPKSTVLATGASSPVLLYPGERQARKASVSLIVGSEGYAWARIKVDFKFGGKHVIELQPGGDLEVFLSRPTEQPLAVIRLRREGDWQLTSSMHTRRGGPFLFKGLLPGTYDVSLEVGDSWDAILVLGDETTTIEVGAAQVLSLELEAPPEYAEARLAGTLIIPTEWELHKPRLMLVLLDTPLNGSGSFPKSIGGVVAVAGKPGLFSFDFGEIQTGSYSLSLRDLSYEIGLELDVHGAPSFLFEIPPPAEISVLLLDTATGIAATTTSLRWYGKRPNGLTGGTVKSVSRAPGEQRFRFRVPSTEVVFMLGGGEYQNLWRDAKAVPGADFVFELSPSARAFVTLLDGEEVLSWVANISGAVKKVSGAGYVDTYNGAKFAVNEEGRYRLTLPERQGYELPDPVEFEMRNGANLEIIVQLTRKP